MMYKSSRQLQQEARQEVVELIVDLLPGELQAIGEFVTGMHALAQSIRQYEQAQQDKEKLLVAQLLDCPYKSYTFDDWYFCNPNLKIDFNMQINMPQNIEDEMKMTHDEYIVYLRRKYGAPPKPYYRNRNIKNQEVDKMQEGLFLHHLAEECRITWDEIVDYKFAEKTSASVYDAENFVYCNFIEHLLLHIKIAQEDVIENNDRGIDIMGAQKLWRLLNKYYTTGNIGIKYRKAANAVQDKTVDYMKIMAWLAYNIKNGYAIANHCTLQDLAEDDMGVVHQEILDILSANNI